MEAFSLVRGRRGAVRERGIGALGVQRAGVLEGDFAAGLRNEAAVGVRGDFATGARTLGGMSATGDFATGFRSRKVRALPTGSFATGGRE
jgi:hypothetical protein